MIYHAWGMTEISPLGSYNRPKRKHQAWPADARRVLAAKQGRPPYGIEMKIIDDDGEVLSHDGAAVGELLVRGQWVVGPCFNVDKPTLRDGWTAESTVGKGRDRTWRTRWSPR